MSNLPIEYIHIKNSYAHKDLKISFKLGKNYIVAPNGKRKI